MNFHHTFSGKRNKVTSLNFGNFRESSITWSGLFLVCTSFFMEPDTKVLDGFSRRKRSMAAPAVPLARWTLACGVPVCARSRLAAQPRQIRPAPAIPYLGAHPTLELNAPLSRAVPAHIGIRETFRVCSAHALRNVLRCLRGSCGAMPFSFYT
jgi:hypothetical protein